MANAAVLLVGCFACVIVAQPPAAIDTKIVNRPPGDIYGCKLPNRCVPFYQCTEENIINTDGEGLLDLRTKLTKPNKAAETEAAPAGAASDGVEEKSGIGGLVGGNCPDILSVCCLDPEEQSLLPPPKPHVSQCGTRHDLGIDVRITYDKDKVNKYGFDLRETQFGEYPWMGVLLKESISGPAEGVHFLCGASLIHPQVVMTAAHCLRPAQFNPSADRLLVRAGEWDTTNDYEPYPHQDRYVSKVIRHPDYQPGPYYNNIALLFLDKPFIMERHIDTICLPKPGYTFPPGTQCVATGFGKDAFENGAYQKVMKQVNVPIVERNFCIDQLRSTRLGDRFKLHPTYFCAGGKEGQDTCTGDGGGPLICKDPGSGVWIQSGIVAWGIGCANALPAVYTDVEKFVEWVDYEVSDYFRLPKPYWGYTNKPLGGPRPGPPRGGPGPVPSGPGGLPGNGFGPGGPGGLPGNGFGPGGPGGLPGNGFGPGGPGGLSGNGFGPGPLPGGAGAFPGGPGFAGPGSSNPPLPGSGRPGGVPPGLGGVPPGLGGVPPGLGGRPGAGNNFGTGPIPGLVPA